MGKRIEHEGEREISNEEVISIITDANPDMYFCIKCLVYLGNDTPEGFTCGECYTWYCEDCAKSYETDEEGLILNCPCKKN